MQTLGLSNLVFEKPPVVATLPGRDSSRLSETVHRALLLTGATGAALALRQHDRTVTRARAGWNAPDLGSVVDADSFGGLCLKTGRTLYCNELESDVRVNAAACRALEICSMVVTPVREGSATVGVLAVFSRKPQAFTHTHRLALEALAWTLSEGWLQDKKSAPAAPPVVSDLPVAAKSLAKPVVQPAPAVEKSVAQAVAAQTAAKPAKAAEPRLDPPAHVNASGVNWGAISPTPAQATAKPGTKTVKAEAARAHAEPSHILRFHKSERMLHWSIAIPFLVCFTSALVLVVVYNPHPQRHFRIVFSLLHRISGACLMLFPALTALRHHSDHKIHLYNIREAVTWVADDVKWLFLMGAAAINKNISLPEQGKFNAAEKLNFIMVMCTYPLFIATGLVLAVVHVSFLSWMVHVGMAAMAAPLVCGHIFMATINPETRVGLSGMLTGYVDRHWARHHYTRWYREHFEAGHAHGKHGGQHRQPPLVQCPSEAK